jgi:hypothetical protein
MKRTLIGGAMTMLVVVGLSTAFGSTGPTWLAEGLAELGNYWRENDGSVELPKPVVGYLQQAMPKRHLLEIATPGRAAAGSWQDYAWRWALCHLLANNPNYSDRFVPLAIGLMEARPDTSFELVYGPVARQLAFEYDQFLATLGNGARTELADNNGTLTVTLAKREP